MSGMRWGTSSELSKYQTEIVRFGAVGLLGVALNLVAFNVLRLATDLQTVRASAIATAIAIVGNYIGFRHFAYRDRETAGSQRYEMALFAFFSAVGLLIENGVLYTTTYGIGLNDPLWNNIFKFTGIGVATLFRFWSYRTWVFKTARQCYDGGAGDPLHDGGHLPDLADAGRHAVPGLDARRHAPPGPP